MIAFNYFVNLKMIVEYYHAFYFEFDNQFFHFFLFLKFSSIINFSNISCLQITFFQKNFAMISKFVLIMIRVFIYFDKSFRTITKYVLFWRIDICTTFRSIFFHKNEIQIEWNVFFVRMFDFFWHFSHDWIYWRIFWCKLFHQY